MSANDDNSDDRAKTINNLNNKWNRLSPENEFLEVSVGFHSLPNENFDQNTYGLKIMAAGFIDNDSRTDLVTTNQDQNSF